jgi:hypothetical protein
VFYERRHEIACHKNGIYEYFARQMNLTFSSVTYLANVKNRNNFEYTDFISRTGKNQETLRKIHFLAPERYICFFVLVNQLVL